MGKRVFVALWAIWALCVCVTANASNATTIDRIKTAIETRMDNERFLQLQSIKLEKLNRIKAGDQQAPEPEMTYLGKFRVTGYDVCVKCCGNTNGITASGTTATVGRTCAAPRDIPFGTVLWIDGIGERIVEDRGGAVSGKTLDVLCEDHPACYDITGWREVWVVQND